MFIIYYRVFTRVWKTGYTRIRKQLCLEQITKLELLKRQAELNARGIEIVIIGAYSTMRMALDKYNTLRRVRAEREKRAGLSSP